MAVSSSIWSRPQEFAVDSATGIAKVGAGVQVGNLALDIYDQGRRALPPWNLFWERAVVLSSSRVSSH